MAPLKPGEFFPEGVTFTYVAPSEDAITACGLPITYKASEEFKDKKVVLIAVPGAFTPTCQEKHIQSYLENLDELKAKGVDAVVVVAFNDHWVMDAWRKANAVKDPSVIFASDAGLAFSKSLGWSDGERAARYLIVVDQGKVVYAGIDTVRGSIEKSGAKAALAHL